MIDFHKLEKMQRTLNNYFGVKYFMKHKETNILHSGEYHFKIWL